MALPVPYFQAGWKTTAAHTLTFTYGGTGYDVVIPTATSFDSTMDLLIWIHDELEDQGLEDIFWFTVTQTGYVQLTSAALVFSLSEVTSATYGVLTWLGLNPAGYSAIQTVTASTPYYRGWHPLLPLTEAPELSRSLNPIRATHRPLSGGDVFSDALVPTGSRGGFVSARFRCELYDVHTVATALQTIARMIGFLSGYRAAATDIDYGGAGFHEIWTGYIGSLLDLDALPAGGASENAFVYFDEWLDPADYTTYDDYSLAVVAAASTWYLHPDTKELVLGTHYDRMGDHWLTEFTAFMGA